MCSNDGGQSAQLCFAFRRWLDIDIAKDVYRNITSEKLALLKFLNEREKNAMTAQQLWTQTNQVESLIFLANSLPPIRTGLGKYFAGAKDGVE